MKPKPLWLDHHATLPSCLRSGASAPADSADSDAAPPGGCGWYVCTRRQRVLSCFAGAQQLGATEAMPSPKRAA
jgi:hypothetical protein